MAAGNAREPKEFGAGAEPNAIAPDGRTQDVSNHASPVAKIAAETPEAACLAVILAASVSEQDHWMCAPVYRDALAFYDGQDNLCGVLNICFGCDKMITHQQREVTAGTATYQELKQFMTGLGHVISEK